MCFHTRYLYRSRLLARQVPSNVHVPTTRGPSWPATAHTGICTQQSVWRNALSDDVAKLHFYKARHKKKKTGSNAKMLSFLASSCSHTHTRTNYTLHAKVHTQHPFPFWCNATFIPYPLTVGREAPPTTIGSPFHEKKTT